MKIGFDLDKIFIDYPPLIPDRLIDRLYRKKTSGELLYRIPSRPEQAVRRLSHISFFRPPIQKNITFLKSLTAKNHELYLISSRFQFLESATTALLRKYGFDEIFDGMYLNYENKQPHLFKNEVLKMLSLDIYVDDDLALLQFVSRENPQITFYWLNQINEKKEIAPNIFAISDLSCILE